MMRLLHRSQTNAPVILMQQLAVLIPAGIPIARCFDMLEKSQHTDDNRQRIYKIKQQLLAGRALHQSLQIMPDWFDLYSIKLIHLGEQTGKLDHVLQSLARHYEHKTLMLRKVQSALFYPMLILFTALLLTFCLFIYVMPLFADIFHESSATLPWITRSLFMLSAWVNQNLVFLVLILLLSVPAVNFLYRKGKLKLFTGTFTTMPGIERITRSIGLIRFTRHLSLALSAGMPIMDALHLTSGLSSHPQIMSDIRKLRSAVASGASLHHAMQSLITFPPMLQQMIQTGEETGQLDVLLLQCANLMESELEAVLSRCAALFEPLIMLMLGVLIGGMVIGIYLPVFNLGSAL